MKRNCKFQMNPAFNTGLMINFAALVLHSLLEPAGTLNVIFCFVRGAAVGLLAVGLLYGSPKTRPLFDRFRAFKMRLLGREGDASC